ncbi:hypothetical protein [Actinobaculum sp. 352]|uniref:hypothetical protein n=1 Tax=Actinobaculum sp. 352 TaxID=2490946 RepID=UPI000F7EA410|nr:hypothetical protein [Actinobaculum sp. 352]RTE49322.1 hypothetical protein EKN07_07080 [Actinobaculum sp. 352]
MAYTVFRKILRISGAMVASASAAYGVWVAIFYEGVIPALLPFAAVATVGAVLAAWGAVQANRTTLAAGMAMQILSPTGAAWILSLLIGLIGIGLLVGGPLLPSGTSRAQHDSTDPVLYYGMRGSHI